MRLRSHLLTSTPAPLMAYAANQAVQRHLAATYQQAKLIVDGGDPWPAGLPHPKGSDNKRR